MHWMCSNECLVLSWIVTTSTLLFSTIAYHLDFHFDLLEEAFLRHVVLWSRTKTRVLNLDPGLSLRLHLEHRNLELGDSLGWLLWRLRGKHCMFMTLVLLQLLEEVDECSSRNQWLVERVGRRGGHVSSSAPQKLLGCGEQSRAGWRPGRYEGSIILIISLLMVDLLGDICPDSWLLDLPFFVSNIFITRVVWVLKGDNQW